MNPKDVIGSHIHLTTEGLFFDEQALRISFRGLVEVANHKIISLGLDEER